MQENWPKSAIEYAEFLLVNLKDAIAVECDENTMTKDSTNKVNLLLLVFFCYGLHNYLVFFFHFVKYIFIVDMSKRRPTLIQYLCACKDKQLITPDI